MIERNLADLEFLMSRWNTKTHTFVASWGKFSTLLEDVAMLTSLPLFGKAHAIRVTLSKEDQKRVKFLRSPSRTLSIRPMRQLICH